MNLNLEPPQTPAAVKPEPALNTDVGMAEVSASVPAPTYATETPKAEPMAVDEDLVSTTSSFPKRPFFLKDLVTGLRK